MSLLKLHNGSKFTKYVMPYLVVMLTLTSIVSVIIVIELKTESEHREDTLIENCEKNGNPLREGVRKLYQNEIKNLDNKIKRSHEVDYEKLFSNSGYTPEEFKKLLKESEEETIEELSDAQDLYNEIHPVICKEQFK